MSVITESLRADYLPDPNPFVFGGMKAFALSTMGRWRLGEDLCPVRR